MDKRKVLLALGIISIIYFAGFFISLDSINLHGIPEKEKSFYMMDDEGIPYMYELDSYYHYRLTKNFLEHGYLGDTIINGIEWDSYSYYPPGVPLDYPPLLIYLSAFLYKLINLFATVPLLVVGFWLPAFFGPLAGVITYLFVRRFSDDVSGIVAGLLVVLSPFYLQSTVRGWFDTDMFNIFFPVLVVWTFLEALRAENLKMKIIYSLISAFSLFLFSLAWNGWQYSFYLILFFTSIFIIWGYIKGKKIKNCLITLTIFSGCSLILILIFSGYINFLKPFYGLLEIFNLMGNPWSPWPNLYLGISELKKPSIMEIVTSLGFILLSLGILGFLLIFRILKNNKIKIKYMNKISWFLFLFLILWTIVGFLSLSMGVRFIILIIPPLSISAGIGIGILIKYLKNFNLNKRFINFSIIFLLIILILPQFLTAHGSINVLKPAANDDLWEAAEWIKINTPKETVIISDWSYGHFLTGIAERPVLWDGRSAYIETLPVRHLYGDNLTFDGKIPNTSREYWISKAYSTSNESLSLGIFTMLANSGDYAYLTINEYTNNTTESVIILNDILGLEKSLASEILSKKYNFDENQVSTVLKYSHPSNSVPFVILTYDRMMISTSKFNIAGRNFCEEVNGNYTYSIGDFEKKGSIINSSNNVTINYEKNHFEWNNKKPFCFISVEGSEIKKEYINPNSNFCIILQFDSEKSIVIDKRFENSLFTKLIIEKKDTKNFESIYKNKKVVVWKVTSC